MRVLEESRAVIEDEVDTRELLPRLQEDAGERAQENAVAAVAETVCVGALADFFFLFKVEPDLVEVLFDGGVVH